MVSDISTETVIKSSRWQMISTIRCWSRIHLARSRAFSPFSSATERLSTSGSWPAFTSNSRCHLIPNYFHLNIDLGVGFGPASLFVSPIKWWMRKSENDRKTKYEMNVVSGASMDRAAFASVYAHYVEDKRRRKVNSERRFYANMKHAHTHNAQFYVLMKKQMEAKRKIRPQIVVYTVICGMIKRNSEQRESKFRWTITAATFNYTVFALNSARSGVQIGSHRRTQTYFGKSNKWTNYFVRFCLTDWRGGVGDSCNKISITTFIAMDFAKLFHCWRISGRGSLHQALHSFTLKLNSPFLLRGRH